MTDYHLPTEKQAYYGTEEESTRGGRGVYFLNSVLRC
jgi:hypothetical protein